MGGRRHFLEGLLPGYIPNVTIGDIVVVNVYYQGQVGRVLIISMC
ncbi:hypothetical protein SAMN05428949_3255 [Chitinophaga sp. YR627]|nr:hypothetical protein SAMN05428949_3255 [Chitinophaga sp. YR627]